MILDNWVLRSGVSLAQSLLTVVTGGNIIGDCGWGGLFSPTRLLYGKKPKTILICSYLWPTVIEPESSNMDIVATGITLYNSPSTCKIVSVTG